MSRAPDEFPRPGHDAADGGAETFAEAQRHRVEAGAVFLQGSRARGDCFPEAGTIEVEGDVVLAREAADGSAVGQREDGAVEGVFEGDEPCRAMMDVVVQHGVFLHVEESQVVVVLWDDLDWESAREGAYAAGFPLVDVGSGVGEDGVRRLGHVGTYGELVALGAGGDEEGGGKAGQVGDVGFERYGGGVFGEDIVEEGAILDGVEHGGGRSCDDVAWDETGASIGGVGRRGDRDKGGERTAEVEGCWARGGPSIPLGRFGGSLHRRGAIGMLLVANPS